MQDMNEKFNREVLKMNQTEVLEMKSLLSPKKYNESLNNRLG
jgi:hypothetical protein